MWSDPEHNFELPPCTHPLRHACLTSQRVIVGICTREVVGGGSAQRSGWLSPSVTQNSDLWSRFPASRVATLTALWKSPSTAHWPGWTTSSVLSRVRFLSGWFQTRAHASTRAHSGPADDSKRAYLSPPFAEREDIVSLFFFFFFLASLLFW